MCTKLKPVMDDIIKVMEKHGLSKPAVAIAFTTEKDYRQVHWMTNVSREDGVELFKKTARKMISKSN